jgi:hypothetical protein
MSTILITAEGRTKMPNKKIQNFHISPDIIQIIKTRKGGICGTYNTHEGDEKCHTKFQLENLKEVLGITGFLDCSEFLGF